MTDAPVRPNALKGLRGHEALDLHDLPLLGSKKLVDLGDVLIRHFLDLVHATARLVLADLVGLFALDFVLLPRVPDRDPSLCLFAAPEPAPCGAPRSTRDRNTDHVPSAGLNRIRAHDRLLDLAQQTPIPGWMTAGAARRATADLVERAYCRMRQRESCREAGEAFLVRTEENSRRVASTAFSIADRTSVVDDM